MTSSWLRLVTFLPSTARTRSPILPCAKRTFRAWPRQSPMPRAITMCTVWAQRPWRQCWCRCVHALDCACARMLLQAWARVRARVRPKTVGVGVGVGVLGRCCARVRVCTWVCSPEPSGMRRLSLHGVRHGRQVWSWSRWAVHHRHGDRGNTAHARTVISETVRGQHRTTQQLHPLEKRWRDAGCAHAQPAAV